MRRGDVDDAPPFALEHLRQRRADRVERRRQVDGDDRVPLIEREVVHRRGELNAGIVHQNVDPSEVASSPAPPWRRSSSGLLMSAAL